MLKCKDKKAQVGSTTTWIVATVIIVIILSVFYIVASTIVYKEALVMKVKKFTISIGFTEKDNLLVTKSVISYLETPEGQKARVKGWLDVKKLDVGDYINE
jgi:hypothetical protein